MSTPSFVPSFAPPRLWLISPCPQKEEIPLPLLAFVSMRHDEIFLYSWREANSSRKTSSSFVPICSGKIRRQWIIPIKQMEPKSSLLASLLSNWTRHVSCHFLKSSYCSERIAGRRGPLLMTIPIRLWHALTKKKSIYKMEASVVDPDPTQIMKKKALAKPLKPTWANNITFIFCFNISLRHMPSVINIINKI